MLVHENTKSEIKKKKKKKLYWKHNEIVYKIILPFCWVPCFQGLLQLDKNLPIMNGVSTNQQDWNSPTSCKEVCDRILLLRYRDLLLLRMPNKKWFYLSISISWSSNDWLNTSNCWLILDLSTKEYNTLRTEWIFHSVGLTLMNSSSSASVKGQ